MAWRPLIGVTTSEVRVAEEVHRAAEGEPPRPEMALGLTYLKAIEGAGGIPVAIPPLGPEAVTPLVERLSGRGPPLMGGGGGGGGASRSLPRLWVPRRSRRLSSA